MRKEQSEITNKVLPDLAESENRRRANEILEPEFSPILRDILLMLGKNEAILKIDKQANSEYVTVIREVDGEQLFMTKEPSEIALLKDPAAGLKFLAENSY